MGDAAAATHRSAVTLDINMFITHYGGKKKKESYSFFLIVFLHV